MAEYISREAALNAVRKAFIWAKRQEDQYDESVRQIERIPASDVREVVKAHWEWNPDGMDWDIGAWCCSECKSKAETWWANDSKYNPLHCSGGHFCGNCGADMREVEHD